MAWSCGTTSYVEHVDILLIGLLTFVASGVGTLTGFGTSTIMVPVLVSVFPLPQALLLVGIVHWFGNVWKMVLFRRGIRWHLILAFGIPGLIATVVGGMLVFRAPEALLARVFGGALLAYVVFLAVKGRVKVPEATSTAVAGGTLYGFTAGAFGIGGAVRSAFLSAYDLPKAVFIATGGAIGLAIDSARLVTYLVEGAALGPRLLYGLLLFIPMSFAGAAVAKKLVDRIPQERFRTVIAVFLAAVGVRLLLFPPIA
jgi:uncharacterized protein